MKHLRQQLGLYPLPLLLLALSNLVQFTARGMFLPFIVIFFGQIIGINEGLVGAGLAVSAVSGIIFTLLLAGMIDRFGPRPILIATIIGIAGTILLYPLATTPSRFFALMFLYGIVTGLYWPASDSLAMSFLPISRAGEVFALLRVVMALGMGGGGLIGGLMVSNGTIDQYRLLFLTAGIGVAAAGVMVWVLVRAPVRRPAATVHTADTVERAGSWGAVLADRRFLFSQVVVLALLFGFTQFQVAMPPYLRAEAGISEAVIGTLFAVNTVIVLIGQIPVARRIVPWRRGATLALAAVLWTIAYALFGASIWAAFLPFLAVVVFTLGEMLFMSTSGLLVVELAPERLRGRYLAFHSNIWGVAFGFGSWTSGTILASSMPGLLWPVLMTVFLAGAVGARAFDRGGAGHPRVHARVNASDVD